MNLSDGNKGLVALLGSVQSLLSELEEAPEFRAIPTEDRPEYVEKLLHELVKKALRDQAFSDYLSEVMWEINQEDTDRK